MFDPNAPSSKLREQRSTKKCPDKQIMAQNLWPSIRLLIRLHGIKLQGIRLLNIKPLGIMLNGARLLSTSGLSRDLFLRIIVANPRPTNPGPLKSLRRRRMINTARSYLVGCRA